VTLEAPVGYLAPEARVLVHGVGTERRFVGATATPEFVRGVGHDNARAVHLATITAWAGEGLADAKLSDGSAIQVAGLTQRTAMPGLRFACLYEGQNLVRAISSALP
ncbi:MAG: hypothetical protein ACRD0Q_00630, partial [Acidimicrobiales bacterium]